MPLCWNIFDCNKNKFDLEKELQETFLSKHTELNNKYSCIHIGNHVYQTHVVLEEVDIIMRVAQVEWCRIQDAVLCSNTLPYVETIRARELINQTFHSIIESIHMCDCPFQRERCVTNVSKTVDTFLASVIRISQLQDDILLKLSMSSMNNVNDPIYQFFHCFLDIQYFIFKVDYVCGQSEDKLMNRLKKLMEDLLLISKKNYKRKIQHAFICSCMKNIWLIIQTFSQILEPNRDTFWEMFNLLLENEEPIFSLWILKSIFELEFYRISEGVSRTTMKPNYNLLESKLKQILLNTGTSTLVSCFKIVEPLVCNLWLNTPRIEVFQIMWDYFSKRLNISNKKSVHISVSEFIELIYIINISPIDCTEDFEIFIGMLICHLRKHPTQWGKIKGRIYSQLGPNKLKDLNEIGITHVMLLYLSLCSVNLNELSKKIISFVEHLPLDKKYTSQVWNCCIVFIIINVKEGNDLEGMSSLMLQMLQHASCEKMFHLLKEFVINFKDIINSSKSMQLHQWLLLNTWLPKYVMVCHYPDLKVTLDVLLCTLNQVDNPESWTYWEPTFKEHIYPSLKQLCNSPTAPDVIGQISGKLCLLIRDIFTDCFNFFTSEKINSKISYQFLNIVLENYPNNFILTEQQSSTVIQSWIKICLLHLDLHEGLTNNVLKLDYFPDPLKMYIQNSQHPLHAFVEYFGNDLKKHTQPNSVIKLCEVIFGQTDKWLAQYLVSPDDEVVVLNIYNVMSLAFSRCGSLLYDRNKTISPLTKLVQVLLLPTTFLIGKPLHIFVFNAIKKTWHIFFEAIVNLNNTPDTFLERTLRDMVAKYMYYFPTSDSPLLNCLENELTASTLLDKICNLYFKQQVNEPEANVLKVLQIINIFVQSTTSLTLMKLIVSKILYGLYEVNIFHPQLNAEIGVIKTITCSSLFPQVKAEFNKSVLAFTEKHLALNTTSYFRLMDILTKFAPINIGMLLGDIKKLISTVERMRGVGFDNHLRALFEQLEINVKSRTNQ